VTRRIRIPGIVDLPFVGDAVDIRALAGAAALDRRFERRGPLVNRLLAGRIRRWFQVDGVPLPALAPRGDQKRAERQASLSRALDPAAGEPLWTEAQLDRLADYVRGRLPREEAGITVQEAVGRRFDPGYVADRASWRAAEMIDQFRDSFVSLRHLWWIVTGRLGHARALLVERARRDPHAMHGTAIGVHGIMDALERMQALHARPGSTSITDEVAVGRCLHPPRRVPRTVEAPITLPGAGRPLEPGAMVMLDLEKAGPHAPDPDIVFMHGKWSFCPAEAFIPALLRAVWRRAGGEGVRR
jgi:hypothetical protein